MIQTILGSRLGYLLQCIGDCLQTTCNPALKVVLGLNKHDVIVSIDKFIQFTQLLRIKSRLSANRLILRLKCSQFLPLAQKFFDTGKADRETISNLLLCAVTRFISLDDPMP